MQEFLSKLSPEVVNSIAVALVGVALFAVLVVVRAVSRTELYKKLQAKYGLLGDFIINAVISAEGATPEQRAQYEQKSRETGYPVKVLIVCDLVERFFAPYGIKFDIETEILPAIERALVSSDTPDNMTPKTVTAQGADKLPKTPVYAALDEADLRVQLAALQRNKPR